jgi:maleylacetoacetate isomerase
LAHKGIEYDSEFVNLLKGENLSEKIVKVNPMGQIPVLVVDGHLMAQSVPIIEFLEETYPQKPLLPKDRFARAKVREICEIICSGIQPIQNPKVMSKHSEVQSEKNEWANYWITQGFQALEKVLNETSGTYCFGNEVTMADCCLVPQIHNAERFGVDLTKFPTIGRINSALANLDSFKAAHAFVQPDCPPELRIQT